MYLHIQYCVHRPSSYACLGSDSLIRCIGVTVSSILHIYCLHYRCCSGTNKSTNTITATITTTTTTTTLPPAVWYSQQHEIVTNNNNNKDKEISKVNQQFKAKYNEILLVLRACVAFFIRLVTLHCEKVKKQKKTNEVFIFITRLSTINTRI